VNTERTAKTPPAKTGLSATLRAFLPGAKGSGAPSRTLLASFLIALATFLAPAAAQAAPPALIPFGQIETPEGALGITVDNSAGPSQADVYVASFFAYSEAKGISLGRVNKYGSSGNLLAPPSPFGVANEFGEKGSGYSGVAVNPTNGALYVLDALYSEIDVFDPATGALESSFPVLPSANYEFFLPWTMVQIATDSAGNVYVPVAPENKVLEYDPSECPALPEPCTLTPLKTFTGGSGAGALKGPTAVAVDPSGNLWVADTGNKRLEQLSPAGAPLGEIPTESERNDGHGHFFQPIAVDTHGHVFTVVDNSADSCGSFEPPCSHLLEFDSAGAQLIDLGAGQYGESKGPGSSPFPQMVAVNDSSGRVYVTDGENSRVFIYTPPTPPSIENELAVGVTTTEAKLGALLNPGGIGTSYRFEYGETTAYGHSAPNPEGDAGTGLRPRTVWASPSGLQPGTTYHYRVVVANELGEVQGQDKTFTTETAAQAACPNDPLRTGYSASLPDCRAYELVTPPNKSGAQPDRDSCDLGYTCDLEKTLSNNFAAADGNRLAFIAQDVFPGSQSGGHAYLATRGPAGWSFENELPPQNYQFRGCQSSLNPARSEDLSRSIFSAVSGGICGLEPELISGEPRGTQNIYLRDNVTGAYQLLNLTPPAATPADAHLLATSRDFSRIVFEEEAQLTPEALAGVDNLYEWSAGHLRLVTLLPDETPVAGSLVTISADGSRVFFKAAGNLYARVDGTETIQLDASQASGPGGGGEFLKASFDGSRVIFTADASAALTADTESGSGTNLYLYDSTAPAGQRLTDLTPSSNPGSPVLSGLSFDGSRVIFTADASAALTADTEPGSGTNLYRYAAGQLTDLTPASHAEVQGASVSEDGSSVYFRAEGVLTGEPNQHDETAQPGQSNLYLSRAGATTFVIGDYAGGTFGRSKVSANGAFFALESIRPLTGYDNTGDDELYLYDAAANTLACASCNPSGEPPIFGGAGPYGAGFEGRPARNLTENGRLFFDTPEALLPSDTNGAGNCPTSQSGNRSCLDVYEFEPAGVGTCADPAGCLFLISTGTGSRETVFIDASANGNDVFLREFQALVPRANQEDATSLYDVRSGGGFPEPGSPPACTTAESCRPSPQPQPTIAGSPATATPSGPGNEHPKRHKPKHHHHKKHQRRHAHTSRGGSK
jgi:DNA-binding beta-propeller fold protein YncE